MKIEFAHMTRFEGWSKFPSFIGNLVITQGHKRICEIGAGANPALSSDFIKQNALFYNGIDEDSGELAKANRPDVDAIDVCEPNVTLPSGPFDLVCSRMVAEHFRDPINAHLNIFRSLRAGGVSVHSFACLYNVPFLINKWTPSTLSERLLDLFNRRDRDHHEKFTAYYRRCRGPIRSQIRFFERLGYEVLEYRGYFGHGAYYDKVPVIRALHEWKTQVLLRHPVPLLTSYATIVLRRPESERATRAAHLCR
jgi:SAM-dependent methyltransferase